jgi:superfamily II DNA or RNA helicase
VNKRNLKRKLERIFTKRGFDTREHSIKNILDYLEPCLPHVTAIGTSGGKTMTTAARLELLYQIGLIKPDEKVLILAADKTILRENFINSFNEFFEKVGASFSYRAVANKEELIKALEDDVQVIITLPQTLNSPAKLRLVSDFNWKWFVQDEAHKWYFKKTVQRIIENIQPKYQSLLTGTPFKFNKINQESPDPKYVIEYTAVAEMYEKGYLSNVEAQVLHSDIALTKLDYVSMLGNLKNSVRISEKDTISAFNSVIDQMVKKLKVPVKRFASTHNITNNMTSVFGKLKKTIIYCHGIPEANYIVEYLRKNNIGAVVTHSKTGIESNSVFNLFKIDDDIKVLVAVQQGREGFDFPELENVIDMTYSKNFALVMQMFGRVLRNHKDISKKFFFKVAPKHTHSYFVDWMNALFMLFEKEWYSTFNGKNGFDIEFPKFDGNEDKPDRNKPAGERSGGARKPGTFKPTNLSNFSSLEFMSKNKWFKLKDTLSTVAHTTLGAIVKKHRSDEALTLKAEKYIDGKIQLVDAYLENPLESLRSKRQYQLDDFYIEEFSNKNDISKEVSAKFLEKPIKKLQSERSSMLLTNSF